MKKDKDIDNIMRRYRQYLRLECSYSDNTLDAYFRDLDKFMGFLNDTERDVREVTLDDLREFAAMLTDVGIHPRSQARILSGVRSFYRFMVLDGFIEQDPTELLESKNR
jgi:integrase/recombinase XerD